MKQVGITLHGVRFRLGVVEVTGFLQADKGIVTLVPEEGKPFFIPFYVPWKQYNTKVKAYARAWTDTLLEEATDDDKLIDELGPHEIDVITQRDVLKDALSKEKMGHMPGYVTVIGLELVAGLASVITAFIGLPFVCLPCLCGVVGLNIISSLYQQSFDGTIVRDSCGHWVDLSTGRTNLGGGFVLPLEGDDVNAVRAQEIQTGV